MDNIISEKNEDFLGLFHESFSPLKLHVDSGFNEKDIIYKKVVTPLTPIGETVVFKNRWYGKSTSFTIDEEELMKLLAGEDVSPPPVGETIAHSGDEPSSKSKDSKIPPSDIEPQAN